MRFFSFKSREGSALLIVLAGVTVVTILAVYLLVVMRLERSTSALSLNRTQAEALADYASATAIERLREAIDEGRQPPDPSRNYYTTWASEPGRIHIYTISQTDGSITHTYRDMFSAPPGPDASSGNVDLNEASYSGIHPVTGTAAGTMKIGWTPVLANPDQPASAANPAVARIAYWVDDDSCKVDINTADGSAKNDPIATQATNNHFSYGFGTPSEISLQAFPEISALTPAPATGKTVAAAIAEYAAATGFNTPAEIARASANVPANFYQAHQFDLTTRSLTPELNMVGEPRVYLTFGDPLVGTPSLGLWRAAATGPYGTYATGRKLFTFWNAGDDATRASVSGPVDFVYPNANQLPGNPVPFAQYTTAGYGNVVQSAGNTLFTSLLLPYLKRVATLIDGKTSTGQMFHWPTFSGSTTGLPLTQTINGNTVGGSGFGAKYSLRQIDDITTQIYDMSNNCAFSDQAFPLTCPTIVYAGILNVAPSTGPPDYTSRTVAGLGRTPKLTEIYVTASVNNYTTGAYTQIPALQLGCVFQIYFPAGYAGVPVTSTWNPIVLGNDQYFMGSYGGANDNYSGFNVLDAEDNAFGSENDVSPVKYPSYIYPSPATNGYWSDTLLQVVDSGGLPAGFDLRGNTAIAADPDQTKAAAYHPYLPQISGQYVGGAQLAYPTLVQAPFLEGGMQGAIQNEDMSPGTYHVGNTTELGGPFTAGRNGLNGLTITGGIAMFTALHSDWQFNWEVTPINSLRNDPLLTGTGSPSDPAVIPYLQKEVIPVHMTIPPSASVIFTGTASLLLRTRDPLVNQFPGDWESIPNPGSSDITMDTTLAHITYCKGGAAALDPAFVPHQNTSGVPVYDLDGDSPKFKASGGGDPLSVWLPRADIRYPKQSRFPSVGALNYIRTGRIPDDLTVSEDIQAGTPWRSINLSTISNVSQSITGPGNLKVTYPDWAMLDLFTVPFLPQKPYLIGSTATTLRELTSGGATEGKLNINNPKVPYPFDQTFTGVTQTPPTRTAPLEALFYGLQTVGGSAATAYPSDVASPQTIDATTAAKLRASVQNYLATNGAFMLPGQLAEVPAYTDPTLGNCPAINDYTYAGVAAAAQSRNDLMRQVVGATTTQSNTYSIWVVAQTFKKALGNTNYGIFEAGDIVTGQVRRHYTVERYIETGKDGVPGNANNPGPDGIVGTADDPIDPDYNPALSYPLPYRYRITHVEDVML